MKKLILTAAALIYTLTTHGQGTVSINNRVVPDVTARLFLPSDPTSSSSIGSPDWTVSFLGGPKGTAIASMVSLLDAASGKPIGNDAMQGVAGTAAAGYFTPVTATVPSVAAGSPADIAVTVHGPNNFSQTLGPYSVTALGGNPPGGGASLTAPNLPMGTSPIVLDTDLVPEPTTLALGSIGLCALLVICRNKKL